MASIIVLYTFCILYLRLRIAAVRISTGRKTRVITFHATDGDVVDSRHGAARSATMMKLVVTRPTWISFSSSHFSFHFQFAQNTTRKINYGQKRFLSLYSRLWLRDSRPQIFSMLLYKLYFSVSMFHSITRASTYRSDLVYPQSRSISLISIFGGRACFSPHSRSRWRKQV